MRLRDSGQEDHLLRMIRQLGEALARIREMLVGAAAAPSTVRDELSAVTGRLLGRDRGMLEQLDAASAVRLVASPARVELWAQVLELEAEAWERDGAGAHATACRARAQALRQVNQEEVP